MPLCKSASVLCSKKAQPSKSAAILCGVSERAFSFHGWSAGKRNEQPYKRFFDAASRAREQHKANLIAVVREAAHKDARHAEWLLERQFPHEFAPYDRRPIPVEPESEKEKNQCRVRGRYQRQEPGRSRQFFQSVRPGKQCLSLSVRLNGWRIV